jgi:chromate transporter
MEPVSSPALSDDLAEPSPPSLSHGQLFLRFLRFGFMAWGGPVAQIAMLRRELVDEERWISSARFNRLLAVMQALPGPEAHEMCVHLGTRAKGRVGGVLAGLGFMLPGFALMMGLSWLYFAMDIGGSWLGAAFLGIQAAVVALIVRAVHRIGEHILVDRWLWALAIACAAAAFAGVSFWITLPAAGAVYALVASGRRVLAALVAVLAVGLGLGLFLASGAPEPAAIVQAPGEAGHASLLALFLSGLKGGLLTFGGAYTAIPFLRNDAVGRGWMSDGQFLDGLALSGVLPAPLIIFSTFVGYVAGGPLGALVMTAGIFLPAFSFSLILYDRLEAVMEFSPLHRALEGLAAGVVGLIAATAVQLAVAAAQRTPHLLPTVAIFVVSLFMLYVWKNKLNVVAVILAAGAVGVMVFPES